MAAHLRARRDQASGWRPDRLQVVFAALVVLSFLMRLYELQGRTMHYDEAIHLHYAWKLVHGEGFTHSPWMHGPFQVEVVALFLKFIGDSTFIGRLPFALFGTALVALPYFLRDQLGRHGAVAVATLLSLSPVLLYFSRFGRNDIIVAVGMSLLLIFAWRYIERERTGLLLAAAVVTAILLGSKETAYFVIFFFGVATATVGWRSLWAICRRPVRLMGATGAAGFFILIATLALPHTAPLAGLIQEPLGLHLVSGEDGSHGDTGAPLWDETNVVQLPLVALPPWVGYGLLIAAIFVVTPLALRGAAPGGLFRYLPRPSLRRASLSALALLTAGIAFASLFMEGGYHTTIGWMLSQQVGASPPAVASGSIAVNFLVATTLLGVLLVTGTAVGLIWNPSVWLRAAALFYAVWTVIYTTGFQNAGGVFTGSWQSLGYWIAQQEVARGNQPWYYYIVGLTVYELTAFAFGLAAVVWLIRRRRNELDLLVALWVVASLIIYSTASEKMPWLMVNLATPLAFAAGMLIGELAQRVPWVRLERHHWIALLGIPAVFVLAAWFGWQASSGDGLRITLWCTLLLLLPAVGVLAWFLRRRPSGALAAGALGIGVLLFAAVSVPGAVRAAYTYDDSNVEMLVFAQGADDLWHSYQWARQRGFLNGDTGTAVRVDYELWYPLQWYTRHDNKAKRLQYDTLCASDNCDRLKEHPEVQLYLAEIGNVPYESRPPGYIRSAIMRNLLWFPESYRRPNENRTNNPMSTQLRADAQWFAALSLQPQAFRKSVDYILTRRIETDWLRSEYYQFVRGMGSEE